MGKMEKQRYQQARKVTLIGAVINLLLAISKVTMGWLGRSQALIADGIHSFSDLLTDALVLLASKYGSRKADYEHPYGHERIETAATLFLSLFLIIAGLGIFWDAILHLWHNLYEKPHFYVLIVAFISIITNEFLYHYTKHYGKKINSQLLIANAWHHRSDALSSLVVLIGIIGALMGYSYFDAIAAAIVGVMIIKMGASLGWNSVRELIDTGVPEDSLEQINHTILAVPGVITLHQLRTRCMADKILVDAHVLVDPHLSVSEGHYIATKVHQALMEQIPKIDDVTIHVDPENDELSPVNLNLPPRQQVTAELMAHWLHCEGIDYVHNILLHYLEGQIQVDVNLPLYVLEGHKKAGDIQREYQQAVADMEYVKAVTVNFC